MRDKVGKFLTIYLPSTPYVFVYMFQQVEYDSQRFLAWVNRLPDYRRVIRRKRLVITKKSFILLAAVYGFWLGELLIIIWLAMRGSYVLAAGALAWVPLLLVLVFAGAVRIGDLILRLKRGKDLQRATDKIRRSEAVKIAVLGSYGKTTMKEVLATVLSEAKNTAATPGNNNVAISHARWVINTLTGSEEVLIIEFGEYRPGDITAMAAMFSPDRAIITGVAPNHLDSFGSYETLKNELAGIREFVSGGNLYVSSTAAKSLALPSGSFTTFNSRDVLGWKIKDIKTHLHGLAFKMTKGKKTLNLTSGLLGEHLIEPLALAAAIAHDLGLTSKQIESGISKTNPFEHRMKPLSINGAVIIDDTYNGSIEGMRAGLKLLNSLEARRKIYVTPGLVEQGERTETVHTELGKLIAEAKPDKVVLMDNSTRSIIEKSLKSHGYNGELRVESDPLKFYTNIQYEVAAGDIVLMQNDWTDNYA